MSKYVFHGPTLGELWAVEEQGEGEKKQRGKGVCPPAVLLMDAGLLGLRGGQPGPGPGYRMAATCRSSHTNTHTHTNSFHYSFESTFLHTLTRFISPMFNSYPLTCTHTHMH